jgi:hypothetical protein
VSARFAPRLAWALCAASLMLLGLTLLIALLAPSTPVPEGGTSWQGQAILAVALAGAPVLGALITTRRPHNPYGWLWIGFGLAWAFLSFAGSYAEYAAATGKLPAPGAVAAAGGIGWVAGGTLTPFLMLLFPDGRLPSPRWRVLVWTVLAAGAVSVVLGPFMPGQGIASVENPFGVGGRVGEVVFATIAVGVFVIFGCILLSALSLVFRYRRAGGVERQQIKWFAYAAVAFGGSIVFGGFLGRDLPGIWDALFEAVTLSGLYVAVGVAILRYRLYEIDLIINRTLVYGLLTATLVLVYLGGVVLLQYVLRALTGQESQLAVVVSTLAIAALFNPLRRRIQSLIDRLFYRRRYDASKTLGAYSARLRDETDLDRLGDELVSVVRDTVQPEHASVWLRPPARVREEER